MKITPNRTLILFAALSVSLVVIRIVKTEQLSFLFMYWNLFLAFIPYWLSSQLFKQQLENKFRLIVIGILWLLFLPNAPYMITDLFHLHQRNYLPIWYDLVLILSFVITGLYLFYLSVHHLVAYLKLYFPKFNEFVYLPILFLLVSYGVYIGRFLRVNSWDIINPIQLAATCIKPLLHLSVFKDVVCFTFIFSVFLGLMYLVFNPLLKENNSAKL